MPAILLILLCAAITVIVVLVRPGSPLSPVSSRAPAATAARTRRSWGSCPSWPAGRRSSWSIPRGSPSWGRWPPAISHELNQPLTGIRNYARNAFYMIDQKAGGEEEVKNNLRLISEQVDRAAKIINQMRELTRRSDSVFVLLELNSVIRESVEFLLPQMRLSEVTVSLELADDLPPIWGDRIRLAQVFLNLLSNARQAMDGAAVRRLSVTSRRDGTRRRCPWWWR